jgi:hypothetical protein
MTDFEDLLRRALEKQEPSADFTARVMARAVPAKRPMAWLSWRSWAAAGMAAALCLGAVGVEMEHHRRVQREGEAAKAQLMQAMHITSAKLRQIHKRVQGGAL